MKILWLLSSSTRISTSTILYSYCKETHCRHDEEDKIPQGYAMQCWIKGLHLNVPSCASKIANPTCLSRPAAGLHHINMGKKLLGISCVYSSANYSKCI